MNQSTLVTFNDELIECRRSDGSVERVGWDDLQSVIVRTTGDGPFGVDVFWILVGKSSGCVIPSGALGESEIMERLQKLPGFNNLVFIEAMSCVDERDFLCWERKVFL